MSELRLKTQVMGVLATVFAMEGDFLGSVEPAQVNLKPYPAGFTLELVFLVRNTTDRVLTVKDWSFDIAGTVRRVDHKKALVLGQGEVMYLYYAMNASFRDESLDEELTFDPLAVWSEPDA